MAYGILKTGFACALSLAAIGTTAHAGGFARGEADTDILFEEGKVVVRSGVTYVAPQRKYDTINGAAGTDGVYLNDYWMPSAAAKFGISDNLACAATYTQPFGGSADYGPQAQAAGSSKHKEFITNEYGLTCDVKFQAGKGNVHFLGGVFLQDFSYTAVSTSGTLNLDDKAAYGYRLGAAYDIPEYAMRAQLMYRSKIDHNADVGSIDWNPALPLGSRDAYGQGTLPQSLKLSVQSGVAPGWLVYGSVKWTDWSVLKSLDYYVYSPAAIPALGIKSGYNARNDTYNWKDGWTLQAGTAHTFTDKVAGTVNLTWDSGVGNGADIMTNTWTLAAGTSIKAGPGELRLGGAVSYLAAGSQSKAESAPITATANDDWAYALSASYKIAF
ncbi:MAG: OmpP1/FadL family transporter [Allorhizobium sp.]